MARLKASANQQIIDQLKKLPKCEVRGKNVFICCPFPEHRDNTPSFSIYVGRVGSSSVPLGNGYCWGCGRSASWDKIASLLKLDKVLNGAIYVQTVEGSVREALLPRKLTMKMLLNDMNCEDVLPIETKIWRGVPKKLLKEMGCFYSDRVNPITFKRRRVLVIPCYVNNTLVGGVSANLRKIENMNSYFNSPGSWVLKKGYMGFDYSNKTFEKHMPFIMVEGSRDAFFWIMDGYPTTAILGSKVFSPEKARIIVNTGRMIIPFFDGDVAGIKAQNLVCEKLKEVLGDQYKNRVKPYPIIKRAMSIFGIDRSEAIEMKMDPANLPDEIKADFLKHYNRVMRSVETLKLD